MDESKIPTAKTVVVLLKTPKVYTSDLHGSADLIAETAIFRRPLSKTLEDSMAGLEVRPLNIPVAQVGIGTTHHCYKINNN
jgi:hypothetical protein